MRIPSCLLAAVFLMAAPLAAHAGDVRPPANADTTSGAGATGGGQITLPGLSNIDAPEMNTTMKEKRKLRQQRNAVDKNTVEALRNLAIDEFGQSSSSKSE